MTLPSGPPGWEEQVGVLSIFAASGRAVKYESERAQRTRSDLVK